MKSKQTVRVEDIIGCSLTELFGCINLREFQWLVHCDYQLLIQYNHKLPELTSKPEKIEFTETLIKLVEQFDEFLMGSIASPESRALPKGTFYFPHPISNILSDKEVPGHCPKLLAVIDYSYSFKKKEPDYNFSSYKTMIVEFQ